MARPGNIALVTARSAGLRGSGQPQGRRQQQAQGQQRSASLPGQRSKEKKKVNCKPKNQDEQEIPFRLREIMRSRQEMKKTLSNKKRKKEAQVAFKKTLEKEAKGEEPDIAVPKFKQRKGESDVAYVQRMEQEAQHVLFLSKNQAPRQPEVQAAPKKEKSERKKAFQKRRLEKAQRKREARAVDRLEQELLKDTVKFGEVVLQPPELTVQPRRSTSRDAPGKKSLMLKKMLLGPGGGSPAPATSLARQRILGEERERAVQAYRALKKLHRQEMTPAQPPGSSFQRQGHACL
ncbi:coiled-coil domain-containing protein 137 [Mus musculus]|uniref:Coiled-coil domain-containing protein 137 n=2 Tax=Mus musculus TaxID=10090 RepID=CC137_MOUSE|nr:coiled-coil domain-containing protein 137 [Mus musculus]Q8R0K4.1 RecName: Full=Coiled-coil domain-containing protein 137 [Mus musculus]AAH26662.1 Coiled-coil domain containing 137 [Mus musculus]EDL34751.1 RIKEN cDNA 3110023B02, isoform CRA_a [Mus musculus]EDL34752.1 RIKEN cDNA 3110023B02, isoform CRA_a [Mus musculus]|eukprot:NP_690020.1 coiled-coil domain-containing protein 137 [Mus musculus]